MPSNTKNAILKKKIGNAIFEIMVKTTSGMVYVDQSTTLATKLSNMEDSAVNGSLANLIQANTNKIGTIPATVGDTSTPTVKDYVDAKSTAAQTAAETTAANTIGTIPATVGTVSTPTVKAYVDAKADAAQTAAETTAANAIGTIPATYDSKTINNVADYIAAVESKLEGTISGAFHFKGTKDYASELPSTGNTEGDIWQVLYRGTSGTDVLNAEYAWNGTDWVELGSIADLSAYLTTEVFNNKVGSIPATYNGQSTATIKAYIEAYADKAAADAQSAVETVIGTIPATVGETSTPTVKAYVDAKAAAAQAAAESTAATAIGTIPASYNNINTPDVKSYIDAYADKAEADAIASANTTLSETVGNIPATYDSKSTTTVKAYVEAYADRAAADAQAAAEAASADCARFYASATEPEGLTENDLWAQLLD